MAAVRILGDLVESRDPLGMLLRDQALDAVGEQCARVAGRRVGTGSGEIEILLMLQGLGRGTVGSPVLLLLVELLEALENDHRRPESRRDGRMEIECRHGWDRRSGNQLSRLHALEGSLVRDALAVVPLDLVLEALHGGVIVHRSILSDETSGRIDGRHIDPSLPLGVLSAEVSGS